MRNLIRRFHGVLKLLLIILIAGGFYFLGYLHGHRNIDYEKQFPPKLINLELRKPKDVDFSLFWDVYKRINEQFVERPDTQKLLYGSIKGLLQGLDDPYSGFLEPGESEAFFQDLKGEFEGIGAEVEKRKDTLIIVAPLESSPAERAGLRPLDEILAIDDIPASDLSFSEAIAKIRGPKGTTVKLLIDREGLKEPKEFVIKRETILVKSVRWEAKDDVAYIKIVQFNDDTSSLIQKTAEEILAKHPKGVILDLRNNPGGLLDAAVDVTSIFIDPGVVVKEQFRDGRIEEKKTTLSPKLGKLPLVILINKGSASASEIVAGAIQDTHKGKLLGVISFGKGSVQELEDLSGGATLRLTVAKWLTPGGRQISGQGIKPDIEVELSEDDRNAARDPQLERALEEVRK